MSNEKTYQENITRIKNEIKTVIEGHVILNTNEVPLREIWNKQCNEIQKKLNELDGFRRKK